MNSVNKKNAQKSEDKKTIVRVFIFPACVVVCYGILSVIDPHKVLMALKTSCNLLITLILPLALVFVIMLAFHLFLKPARIVGLFGKRFDIKGIVLSVVAGIISMGPIYAWYPLLKNLREKGAGPGPIAIFLYSRAIKPFLLPVMIASFGWVYVVILTLLIVIASIAIGYLINVLMSK